MFDTDMKLPMPDEKAHKNQMTEGDFKLIFHKPEINANNNRIEYRADVELRKQ